ncbi:hypothetical protein PO883_12400 [Massilia sp. DJPM01]|uniref:hypothetical protein n=1 Tax=Massilia sp. DJPM01 TaxID=3024404 RepID=UPI00259F94A7|nr:hypothetical protein [Massilia sp. DJPM01]MDM5177992.1 hypothetical protein [Massilia sp. DJPM01]
MLPSFIRRSIIFGRALFENRPAMDLSDCAAIKFCARAAVRVEGDTLLRLRDTGNDVRQIRVGGFFTTDNAQFVRSLVFLDGQWDGVLENLSTFVCRGRRGWLAGVLGETRASSLSDLENENAMARLKRKNMNCGHHPRHLNAEIQPKFSAVGAKYFFCTHSPTGC